MTLHLTDPLTPDEQKQVEDNMAMVWWEVRRARPKNWEQAQDWAQEAVFGLIKAMRTFNPERSSWSTWGHICIKRHLYCYRKHDGLIYLPVSIPEQDEKKAKDARSIISIYLPSLREFREEQDRDLFSRCLSKDPDIADDGLIDAFRYLTPQQQTLLHMYFVDGKIHREIAGYLGITRQRVCQKVQEAINKLRAVYNRKKVV